MANDTTRYVVTLLVVLVCHHELRADSDQQNRETIEANTPLSPQNDWAPPQGLRDSSDRPVGQKVTEETTPRPRPASWKGASGFGNVLPALAVVLLLIGVGAWGFKRFLPRAQLGAGSAIKMLGRTYLSSRQSLAVVQVGGQVVLIGITHDRISPLAIIDDETEVARLASGGHSREQHQEFERLMEQQAQPYRKEVSENPVSRADFQSYSRARQSLRSVLDRVKGLTTGSLVR